MAAALQQIAVDRVFAEYGIVQIRCRVLGLLNLRFQPLPTHDLHGIAVQLRIAARHHAAAGLLGLGRAH